MDSNEELAERLRDAIGHFVRTTRGQADTIAPPHASTLGYLDRDGAMSIAELAKLRGVRHQSQSRTVMELEDAGHVERRPNPVDARGFVIEITEAGRGLLNGDRGARGRWVAAAIAATLTDAERARLEDVPEILDRLTRFGAGRSRCPRTARA
jgi:DNA-binding MarR family transcriptional regulator